MRSRVARGLVGAALAGPLSAWAEEAPGVIGPGNVVQVFLGLVLVLALVLGTAFVMRRMGRVPGLSNEAIRTIALGRRHITPAVADLLARQLDRKTDSAPHEQLSEREFQVFLKLAKGETAGDIAKALSLSVKTVSTYRTRLMEKMNLSSNSDLTYYALKNKLID